MNPISSMKRFFKKQQPVQIIKDDYLEIATDPTQDDFIVIEKADVNQKELAVQKIGQELEVIAKSEAYKLAVPVSESPDKALASRQRIQDQGYEVHHLSTNAAREKGIFLYALVKKDDNDTPITVVCRGTQWDSSTISDLDPNGPGATVMQQESDQILSQLDEISTNFPNRKIRITGHSLGGSLSQILTASLLKEKRKGLDGGSKHKALEKILGIDTVLFQSAGVSKALAEAAKEDALFIKSQDETFDMNFVAHVKQGDFVSEIGTYLFSDVDSSVVDVSLISRDLDKPCMTLGDCLDVGFAATTGSPVWTALSFVKNLSRRHVKNRLEAHGDYFYHDAKDKTLLPQSYGIYNNANADHKNYIKEVFSKDLTENISCVKSVKETLHGYLKDLNSDEFHAINDCANAAATLVNVSLDVATAASSPINVGITIARKVSETTLAVERIKENQKPAKNGLYKFFKLYFKKDEPTATTEKKSESSIGSDIDSPGFPCNK